MMFYWHKMHVHRCSSFHIVQKRRLFLVELHCSIIVYPYSYFFYHNLSRLRFSELCFNEIPFAQHFCLFFRGPSVSTLVSDTSHEQICFFLALPAVCVTSATHYNCWSKMVVQSVIPYSETIAFHYSINFV